MDTGNDIQEFLTSRRDRLSPQQAGLPDFGGRRRAKGLRREEVSLLAGVSVGVTISSRQPSAKPMPPFQRRKTSPTGPGARPSEQRKKEKS